MTAHTRRESLGQETTSVVSQEWFSGQPQAGAAGAPVLGHAGTHGVGAVATDEPTVLVGDHWPEVDACHAMGAANRQGCVSWHWALPYPCKGDSHVGFQTPSSVISLKNIRIAGQRYGCRAETRRDSGRRAHRRADHAGHRNTQPSSALGEKTKAPQTR
jgi:hypothetical protein